MHVKSKSVFWKKTNKQTKKKKNKKKKKKTEKYIHIWSSETFTQSAVL